MEDRRRAVRHPLEITIELPGASGVTRDFNGLGVLFRSPKSYSAGDDVEFTLLLPDAADVACRGKVVRSTPQAGDYLTAATIERYTLTDREARLDTNHQIHRELSLTNPEGWEWGE